MPHNPCIRMPPFRLMAHRSLKLEHYEAAELNFLCLWSNKTDSWKALWLISSVTFFQKLLFRKKVPKSLFFQQHGFPVEDEKPRQIHFVRGFINFVSRCVSFSRLKIKVNET